jgi:hypothetical protein
MTAKKRVVLIQPHPQRILLNYTIENIDFSLSSVKKVLRHLRECDDPMAQIDVRVKTPRPAMPSQIVDYIKIREYRDEMMVLYYDRWYSSWFAIPAENVPDEFEPYVNAYLKRLNDWKTNGNWEIVKTYPMDYLYCWLSFMSKQGQKKDQRLRAAEQVRNGFATYALSQGISSNYDVSSLLAAWGTSYRFSRTSRDGLRVYRRSAPKPLRFCSLGRGMKLDTFHEYLEQVLRLSHYGKEAFYNQSTQHTEVERTPLPIVGAGGTKIPMRYIHAFYWTKCECCGTYNGPNNNHVGFRTKPLNKVFLEFAKGYPLWLSAKRAMPEGLQDFDSMKAKDLLLYPHIKHTKSITYKINTDLGEILRTAFNKGYVTKHPYLETETSKLANKADEDKSQVKHTPPTIELSAHNSSIYDYLLNNIDRNSVHYNPELYFTVCTKCHIEMYGNPQLNRRGLLSGINTRDYIGNYSDNPLYKYT